MVQKILGGALVFSIFLIWFGVDQIFTVKWGETWYPGLSSSFWKVPDRIAVKLVYYGLILLLVVVLLAAVFKS